MRKLDLGFKSFFLLVLLFAAAEGPVSAGCVSCGPGGECYEATPGFSANCSCVISVRRGITMCKPSGICDPVEPHSCDNEPWINAPEGEQVSSKFLNRVADEDPFLSAALWGALAEDISASGEVIRTRLVTGEHSGTLGKDGESYTYTVGVRQIAPGSFSLSVHLEEDTTGTVQKFEGVVLASGRSGNFHRVGRKGTVPVVSWTERQK